MKIVAPHQMKLIDETAIYKYGIPGIVLMENAARCVVDEILSLKTNCAARAVIFAGKGNNGGDAFAVARHLSNKGWAVLVYALCKQEDVKGDALINLNILLNMGIKVNFIPNDAVLDQNTVHKIEQDIALCGIVVDGIYGTGFKGQIKGNISTIIDIINRLSAITVAIDVPSGVDASSGKVSDPHIKAYCTVTFQLAKIGLLIHPGCEAAGMIRIADIGIPKNVNDEFDIKTWAIDFDMAKQLLPVRVQNSNKGDYGKILLIAGSRGMTGAACLAAKAAYKAGAGLVYLCIPSSICSIYEQNVIDAVKLPYDDENKGFLNKKSLQYIVNQCRSKDVVSIGPGLGIDSETVSCVNEILMHVKNPLVIDADALNALSISGIEGINFNGNAVLTPHPKEMSRLTGLSVEEIENDRIGVALSFSHTINAIVVLKGSRTVVAMPDGRAYINTTGNPGMAVAGSGDLLTGIISAFAGQGLPLDKAAAIGVFVHGLAGDLAAQKIGMHGMTAEDILYSIPYAIKMIARGERHAVQVEQGLG